MRDETFPMGLPCPCYPDPGCPWHKSPCLWPVQNSHLLRGFWKGVPEGCLEWGGICCPQVSKALSTHLDMSIWTRKRGTLKSPLPSQSCDPGGIIQETLCDRCVPSLAPGHKGLCAIFWRENPLSALVRKLDLRNLGVPIVAQWVKDLTLALWGFGFDPRPCSMG